MSYRRIEHQAAWRVTRGHPKRGSDAANGDLLMVKGVHLHCVAENRSDFLQKGPSCWSGSIDCIPINK